MERFGISGDEANRVNGLVYSLAAFTSPVTGILIDKTGKNLIWIFISISSAALSHILIGFTSVTPYVATVGISSVYIERIHSICFSLLLFFILLIPFCTLIFSLFSELNFF